MARHSSNQGLGMGMGMGKEQRQEMTQAQLERATAGRRSDVTTQIRIATEDYIISLIGNNKEVYHQIIDDQNFTGIVGRVARTSLFIYANREGQLSQMPEGMDEVSFAQHIDECVVEAFDEWWCARNNFKPSKDLPSEKEFVRKHGPVEWSPGKTKIQRAKERAEKPVVTHSLPEEVAECVTHMDQLQNVKTSMRHVFERVRSATYKVITPLNVADVLPLLESSYNSAWLDPETIAKLESRDPAVRKEFVQRTRKGVFVSGFHEHINDQPSVAEQMKQDILRQYPQDHPKYEGRYLQDENGEVIAWLTYWQPPRMEGKKNGQMIRKYLRKGVTGGRMKYSDNVQREIMMANADQTLMIDTIRGAVPLAANRLLAKATHEMMTKSPYLKKFMGYRLQELYFHPAITVEGREEVRLSDNTSSSKFFSNLGCTNFAEDRNKKNGNWPIRILPDGREIKLDPEWVAFAGDFNEVRENARSLWLSEAFIYGDTTYDDIHERDLPFWRLRNRT